MAALTDFRYPRPNATFFWERYKKEVIGGCSSSRCSAGNRVWRIQNLFRPAGERGLRRTLASAKKTAADFQKVIAEYPTTAAGGSAYLLLAGRAKE